MKTSYVTRAQKFIKVLFPYIKTALEDSNFPVLKIMMSVSAFNRERRQKIALEGGISRQVFITSDYVVKIDKERNNWAGTNKDEHNMYCFAREQGFDYLFAPTTPFEYNGFTFYIMPRIRNIDESRDGKDFCARLTDEERSFVSTYINDIHGGNFGYFHGKPILIDYAWNNLP